MQVFEELAAIFADMGFAVAEGPDIEDDFHNFTALNFPPGHPAREMHDTFFMKPAADGSRKLLRTHTSPIQVRAMLANKPPIRVIAPGRVYRKDWDATHTPMFHQIEGLVIDETVHMGHLKVVPDGRVLALLRSAEHDLALPPALLPVHGAERGDGYPLRPFGRRDQGRRRQ